MKHILKSTPASARTRTTGTGTLETLEIQEPITPITEIIMKIITMGVTRILILISLLRSEDSSTIRVTGRRMAATTGEIIPIPLITPMAGIMAVITGNTRAAVDTVDPFCRNNEEREWKHSLFLFWEMSNIILLEL